MSHRINNAIMAWDSISGKFDLVDPERYFEGKETLVTIDGDDLITIQLLINAILRNEFKYWREIENPDEIDSINTLLFKLGYQKDEIAQMLREF